MRLQEFLDKHELSTTDFGNKIGVHRNTICNAINGIDIRLSTAIAIEDATFNKVTCRELLPEKNCKDLKKNKTKHKKDDKLEKHA